MAEKHTRHTEWHDEKECSICEAQRPLKETYKNWPILARKRRIASCPISTCRFYAKCKPEAFKAMSSHSRPLEASCRHLHLISTCESTTDDRSAETPTMQQT